MPDTKYTALYRKFRPQTFGEVKGQEHITTTLQNQLSSGRIGHAYLFCGTRGTGKTSVAKIFARAVNCINPGEDGSPCNECEVCRAIRSGASMNVVEIDAASNNGVDSIRLIRDEVQYAPTEGRFKVYIIDEVHMLSIGAFNALLKTLEEPPSYVIFILATTEVHKIPITILSRCQRYDFKRITNQTIYQQLKDLMQSEQVEAEDDALRYVAKAADGSMRDALSLMEQCVSFYFGRKLTYENVLDVLGAVDSAVFTKMLDQIIACDVTGCIETVDSITRTGRDLGQFVSDFIWYMRNLLLIQTSTDVENTLEISGDNLEALRKEAVRMDTDTLIRYIRVLSEAANRMRYSSSKRVHLETTLIQLMMPSMQMDFDSVVSRLNRLEYLMSQNSGTYIDSGEAGPMPTVSRANAGISASQSEEARERYARFRQEEQEAGPKVIEVSQAVYDDFEMIRENWSRIAKAQTELTFSLLKYCNFSYREGTGFCLVCKNRYCFAQLKSKEEHVESICRSIEKICNRKMQLQVVLEEKTDGMQVPGTSFTDVVLKVGSRVEGIEMDLEEEEPEEQGS